eukprot:Anaeramoba_flamelloidesa1056238_37.p1 GENE.a1056238_37~~a1056238_37.p1  ORF type:complete len:331 (-),score=11.38 a1056238_37:28-1020(-)
MKKILIVVLVLAVALATVGCGNSSEESSAAATTTVEKEDLTFVVIPKCVHEWFELVNVGAEIQAKALERELGVKVTVKYMAPEVVDVTAQNAMLEQAAAMHPAGITIDPVDLDGSMAVIESIQELGVPVVLFDAVELDSGLCSVGTDYTEQGRMCAHELARLLDGKGQVAVMHGAITASNHVDKYEGCLEGLAAYPGIEVVQGGASQDNIGVAQEQAAATLAAYPDLDGYLCVDAAAPIGISVAIEEANKQDQITFVGTENLLQILEYVKSGTIIRSLTTNPQLEGALAVLTLWQAHIGMPIPKYIDTGVYWIDQTNVDRAIEMAKNGEF